MISWLKQSTAATLLVGPFLDETDGKTPETGLTLSQADFLLWKQGGTTLAQKNDSTSATHRSAGLYTVPIDDTDTNTLGVLSVSITETGALPVRHDYLVVPANVYDAIVAGSDKLLVDAVELNSSATAAANAAISFAVMATGSVVSDGSNSATTFKTDLTSSTNDYVVNRLLYFYAASAVQGQFVKIGDYNGTTKFVTAAGAETFSTTPTAGDDFIIL